MHRFRGRAASSSLAAAGAAALLGVASIAVPASASAAAPSGSSASSLAVAVPGTGISTSVAGAGLLGLLNPVLSAAVTPLTNVLSGLPATLSTTVASALAGSGLSATNGGVNSSAPGSGSYPTCSTASGWTRNSCYGPVAPAIGAPPLLTLGTGLIRGFAAATATGYVSGTQLTNPMLTVLGIPVGDLGVVSGWASCDGNSSCVSSESVNGTSLLGGLVQLRLANGSNLLQVSLAGGAWQNVSGLNTTLVPVNNALGIANSINALSVTGDGRLLRIRAGIGLTTLLSGLGLGGLLDSLSGLTSATFDGALTITVGPGDQTTGTTAASWGLEVGLDLSGTVSLQLLGGLAGITLGIPTGVDATDNGNLLDLDLAYANAAGGTLTSSSTQWVPPTLQ